MRFLSALGALTLSLSIAGCFSPEPTGIAPSTPAATTVEFDFFAKPLPEIPLPNDLATRADPSSATGRRINASQITPTQFNSTVRELVDQLDGWGLFQTISIPFTGPLDIQSIVDGHRDSDYDPSNDVIYLINVDPDSDQMGALTTLDLGEGNYPHILERTEYWKHDQRGETLSLLLEEFNEDLNGNGKLDLGGDANGDGIIEDGEQSEDTDADGVLDIPNYLPGSAPETLAERADALMTFYERETHTLMIRPMEPLLERTTYAVVVTKRIKDADGNSVGSPFASINHTAQTEALKQLPELLPDGLKLDDVAFAFTFTTQTVASNWVAVRDGLYGHGVQGHIGEEFPAKLKSLFEVRGDEAFFKGITNPYIMHTEEWLPAFKLISTTLQGANPDDQQTKNLFDDYSYVDYGVIGTYSSPQLFERESPENPGTWIGLNLQKWPEDLDRVPAKTRAEDVHFWLFVPRKEVSPRGAGEHVPVAILGHGYTGNRFDAAQFAGYFAKFGIATIAIDNVSHGISLSEEESQQANSLLSLLGMAQITEAILTDRAHDQNGDGLTDTGADFWSTYLFHTRDVVRQTALDYMQLIRIIRSFDGEKTWDLDVNGDGEPDLAGDFDGDGEVDLGSKSPIGMIGGSLGGMMSVYTGSVEPEISAIAPIAAGGGLSDLGVRSQQGGVREAFILRALCPIIVGSLQESGESIIEQIVPDLNDTAEIHQITTDSIKVGDTILVENLDNGVIGCANVDLNGNWRASVESDVGDALSIKVYSGPVLNGDTECGILKDAEEKATLDTLTETYTFQAVTFEPGAPLAAMAEGFGMQRASPDLRRLFSIGQLIVDPADPAVVAPHLIRDPIQYPGTGQQTGTHMLLITTAGDMNVPVSGGMAIARAAGLLPWQEVDERYNKPANQVLLDTYTAEAAHTIGRYLDGEGNPVHIDVENLGEGLGPWESDDIPRLDPPLRLWGEDSLCDDDGCGNSGAIFPFPQPTGQHGFSMPGGFTDISRERCVNACAEAVTDESPDPCGCETAEVFDIGNYLFNIVGRYLASSGRILDTDRCSSSNDCEWIPERPAPREADTLK